MVKMVYGSACELYVYIYIYYIISIININN